MLRKCGKIIVSSGRLAVEALAGLHQVSRLSDESTACMWPRRFHFSDRASPMALETSPPVLPARAHLGLLKRIVFCGQAA